MSVLPGASHWTSVSPASQPGPWFMEHTLSVTVSQSPFWIPLSCVVYSVFFLGGASVCRGVMLVYPRGGWGILCDA
jgi:hypothetical protein